MNFFYYTGSGTCLKKGVLEEAVVILPFPS